MLISEFLKLYEDYNDKGKEHIDFSKIDLTPNSIIEIEECLNICTPEDYKKIKNVVQQTEDTINEMRRNSIINIKKFNIDININIQILKWILTEEEERRNLLIDHLPQILPQVNPVKKMMEIIKAENKVITLEFPEINKDIFKKITTFLKEIHNGKPTKIYNFLHTLKYKSRKYNKLYSIEQTKYLQDLIKNEFWIFDEEYLIEEGFDEDYETIKKYQEQLLKKKI